MKESLFYLYSDFFGFQVIHFSNININLHLFRVIVIETPHILKIRRFRILSLEFSIHFFSQIIHFLSPIIILYATNHYYYFFNLYLRLLFSIHPIIS